MNETRYPSTIDQAITDLREAINDPEISVVPTNSMFLELLETVKRFATVQP